MKSHSVEMLLCMPLLLLLLLLLRIRIKIRIYSLSIIMNANFSPTLLPQLFVVLFLNSSAPFPATLEFYKKLDSFIGPQLTNLANIVCEQSAKKQSR